MYVCVGGEWGGCGCLCVHVQACACVHTCDFVHDSVLYSVPYNPLPLYVPLPLLLPCLPPQSLPDLHCTGCLHVSANGLATTKCKKQRCVRYTLYSAPSVPCTVYLSPLTSLWSPSLLSMPHVRDSVLQRTVEAVKSTVVGWWCTAGGRMPVPLVPEVP